MQKYVRQATPEDAHKLAPKMRKADREEIKASHNSTPLNALLFPFTQLKHKTFTINKRKMVYFTYRVFVYRCPTYGGFQNLESRS